MDEIRSASIALMALSRLCNIWAVACCRAKYRTVKARKHPLSGAEGFETWKLHKPLCWHNPSSRLTSDGLQEPAILEAPLIEASRNGYESVICCLIDNSAAITAQYPVRSHSSYVSNPADPATLSCWTSALCLGLLAYISMNGARASTHATTQIPNFHKRQVCARSSALGVIS